MSTDTKAPPHKEIGDRLRRARVRKGISQENFAPLVGVTRRHLIRIEGGWHRPGDELLARIAEEAGVAMADLLPPQEAARAGDPFRGGGEPDGRGSAARDRGDAHDEGLTAA